MLAKDASYLLVFFLQCGYILAPHVYKLCPLLEWFLLHQLVTTEYFVGPLSEAVSIHLLQSNLTLLAYPQSFPEKLAYIGSPGSHPRLELVLCADISAV